MDTSIWRDYFEDRKDNIKPLGEFAFQFLKNCEKTGCQVLYSGLVVQELKEHYSRERISEVFSSFKHFLEEVPISKEQISEAKKISLTVKESHLKDIMHAILARDYGAIMITRDKHFDSLSGLVEVFKPEEVHF